MTANNRIELKQLAAVQQQKKSNADLQDEASLACCHIKAIANLLITNASGADGGDNCAFMCCQNTIVDAIGAIDFLASFVDESIYQMGR